MCAHLKAADKQLSDANNNPALTSNLYGDSLKLTGEAGEQKKRLLLFLILFQFHLVDVDAFAHAEKRSTLLSSFDFI